MMVRFQTLEEVLDHYASGGHYAINLDPLITDIHLNEDQAICWHSFTPN
ncbi:MAG: hypothetical protein R2769_04155 [Saprospiraceae bacterium]